MDDHEDPREDQEPTFQKAFCRHLTKFLEILFLSLSRLIEGRLLETILKAEPGAVSRRRGS